MPKCDINSIKSLKYVKVLTIAGSDSGGGAGIQADIKAISACGCYAASVVTAVTAQNTVRVAGVHVVPAENVALQCEAVLSDIGADAVKIGMLPTAEIVDIVADAIIKYGIRNVVLDPVMIATSGDRLVSAEAIERIMTRLVPLATVVTPNIPEAEFISGEKIEGMSESCYQAAARYILNRGAQAVLIKSGHIDAEEVSDYLFYDKTYAYTYSKIKTANTHGTGCTLSSAIAAFLAQGLDLPEAVGCAEDYIHKAIAVGADYKTGEGHGPIHHFFKFW